MGKVNIAFIADIHFEKISPKYTYNNLEKYFFTNIQDADIIFVAGDIFDKNVMMSSDAAIYANKFIYKLKSMGKMVIIVHGTLSHDYYQILSYEHLVDDTFKIFVNHGEFKYDGMNFLIVPEEYLDKNEYKQYKKKKYDFVVGHGLFDHCGFISKVARTINVAPIFNHKDFDTYGDVVFGHIHTSSLYKNKVLYVGSFGRFNHGEEEKKGFWKYTYDKTEHKILSRDFIENKGAIKFISINIDKIPVDIGNTKEFFNKLLNENDDIFVRVIIDKNDEKKYNNILSIMKNDKRISVKNTIKKIVLPDANNDGIVDEVELKKYTSEDYINVTISELKKRHNLEYEREEINTFLNSDINII